MMWITNAVLGRIWFWGLLVWLCAAPSTPALAERMVVPNGALQILSLGYENGRIHAADLGVTAAPPAAGDAIRVDCSTGREGDCSLRSRVGPGEDYLSFGAPRAESSAMGNMRVRYHEGSAFRYRFSFKLEDDGMTEPASVSAGHSIAIIWQFKRFNGRPDVFLGIKSDALVMRVGARDQYELVPASVPVGRWIDVDIEVVWSLTDAGRLQAEASLADGAAWPSVELSGPTLIEQPAPSGYLKWGLYRPDAVGRFKVGTVWHDAIRVYRLAPSVTARSMPIP